MPPKSSKKMLWVDCENCGCSITSNNKNSHVDSKCTKDQINCPYINDGQLYSCLERSTTPPENAPRDAVILHPSAATLMNAVIGGPLELSREGAPTLLKRMWPSRSSAPASVILPAADLTGKWCSDSDKKVNVKVYNDEIPPACKLTIKIMKHKIDADICDILKHHFYKHFVSVGSVLVYYYFGKKLDIKVVDVSLKNSNDQKWFLLNDDTCWNLEKDTAKSPKKKLLNLGGVDDILEEINTYIKICFESDSFSPSFQATRGILLYGLSGIGKTAICKHIMEINNCFHIEINGGAIFSKYFGETEATMKTLFSKAVENAPSIILVDEIETICPKRSTGSTDQERRVTSAFVSLLDSLHEDEKKVFVLATSNKPEAIDPMLRRFGRLDKEMEVPIPNRVKRKEILLSLLNNLPNDVSLVDVDSITDLAHGYVASDLVNLCTQACLKCFKSGRHTISKSDLVSALTVVRPSAMRELLIEVPNVKWGDIGGQEELKLKLRQAVEWPLKHAESFRRLGIRPPSGILLYGPPGCSKTMIAKALANQSGLNFLSIKGPELFSKWVGESERAIRDLFTKARQVAPSIIFFDEMDALGGERGSEGPGVNERVLAQLLTELDGVVPLNSVTVIAATNRPDRMDRALLRPGRLDRLIYVPLPDIKTRHQILEIKLDKMSIQDDVDVSILAMSTEGYSGAELEALCHEAAMKALEEDLECQNVAMCHFESVLKSLTPRTPKSLLKIYEEFNLGQKL